MKRCTKCKIEKSLDDFHKRLGGYHARCAKCRGDYMKTYAPRNRESLRKANLKCRFGIDTDEYDRLMETQNKRCAICNRSQSEFKKRFAVDHDHKTGRIRGLLCQHCNVGLGQFGDSEERLKFAIKYLCQSSRQS